MKKIVSLCLAALMLISTLTALSTTALAKGTYEEFEDFTYQDFQCCHVSDSFVYIYGYTGKPTKELVFPDTVDGYPVSAVGLLVEDDEVRGNDYSYIETITVPEGVRYITAYGFEDLKNLKTVNLPNTVTRIETMAFYGCKKLETIRFGNSVNEIQQFAFGNTKYVNDRKDKGAVYLNNCLIHLGKNTKILNVKEGTRVIEEGLFSFNEKLESVTLASTVNKMPVFDSCSALKKVVIPKGITTLERYTFVECSKLETVVLPEGITDIPRYCFRNCKSLKSLKLPDSVTKIYKGAFYGCSALTELTCPKKLTLIGKSAFSGCHSLKKVKLNGKLKSIGVSAFRGTALKSVIIPGAVKTIYSTSFADCRNLKEIKLSKKNKCFYLKKGVLYRSKNNTLVWKP